MLLLLLLSHFSCVRPCATPQTAAHQVPPPWDSPGKNTGVGWHFLLQCWKVKVKSLSRARLLAAYQAPLSMGFSRQEYWSGVPLSFPGNDAIPTEMWKLGIVTFVRKFNSKNSLSFTFPNLSSFFSQQIQLQWKFDHGISIFQLFNRSPYHLEYNQILISVCKALICLYVLVFLNY